MKKSLVMLALSTVVLATAFAAAPASTQQEPQQSTQQPTSKPVEVKKIASQDEQSKPTTPSTQPTTKQKMVLVADEKPVSPNCPNCPKDKKDPSAKEMQRTQSQTPAKTTPAKVALA
jgi:hypothetical protein